MDCFAADYGEELREGVDEGWLGQGDGFYVDGRDFVGTSRFGRPSSCGR